MERNYNFEFLFDFDISKLDLNTREGRWAVTLHEWEKTDAKACKFALRSADEKKRCNNALHAYIREHKLDWVVYCERSTYNLYVVRA